VRPFAKQLLQSVNQHFEVAVFTAGYDWYADPIIDFLDPEGKLIQHRFYRQHCLEEFDFGFFLKDLNVLKNIDLAKTVLVDNNVFSFAFQLDNGIPIVPFEGLKDDVELIKLCKYLYELKDSDDFREFNLKTYCFSNVFQNDISSFIKYYTYDNMSA